MKKFNVHTFKPGFKELVLEDMASQLRNAPIDVQIHYAAYKACEKEAYDDGMTSLGLYWLGIVTDDVEVPESLQKPKWDTFEIEVKEWTEIDTNVKAPMVEWNGEIISMDEIPEFMCAEEITEELTSIYIFPNTAVVIRKLLSKPFIIDLLWAVLGKETIRVRVKGGRIEKL